MTGEETLLCPAENGPFIMDPVPTVPEDLLHPPEIGEVAYPAQDVNVKAMAPFPKPFGDAEQAFDPFFRGDPADADDPVLPLLPRPRRTNT